MNSLILFATILAMFPEFGCQGQMLTIKKINYYVEYSESYSWNKAVIECAKLDMHLATFESVEEFNDANYQGLTSSMDMFWVGAIGDPITYTYTWYTTGKSVIGSMFYDVSAQPDSPCVGVSGGNLFKAACDQTLGFICSESKPLSNCCKKKSNVFVNIKQS